MNADENKEGKYHRPNPNVNLKCRFYEDKYPSADDLVVVRNSLLLSFILCRSKSRMSSITELMSVFSNTIISKVRSFSINPPKQFSGMITPNEYSTVKWKSLHKLFKVGTEEIVMVLRVDTEKGENI